MAEETDPEQLVQRLFDQVNEHLETRWTFFTLAFTEKLSAILANLAGVITLFVFGVLVLFFFCMGFGWWLGDFINNRAGGFALAGLIFVPIGASIFKWIRPVVREKIIEAMLEEQDAKKTNEHE